MPCNCDHLEPKAREREGKLVCELLVYAADGLGLAGELPKWVREGAEYVYGPRDEGSPTNGGGKRVDKAVDMLCQFCRFLDEEQHHELREAVMYDGHKPDARRLADWWEEHQRKDKEAGR